MSEPTPLARALGRMPCGLYIVTAMTEDGPLGFVASFVTQVGFDPPTVAVAIGKDRPHLEAIRSAGCFGVSILDDESRGLMGAFFKKYPEGETALDHVDSLPAPAGSRVFEQAVAWLECEVSGEHEAGDHVVVFGVVESGEIQREAEPALHTRKDGLGY